MERILLTTESIVTLSPLSFFSSHGERDYIVDKIEEVEDKHCPLWSSFYQLLQVSLEEENENHFDERRD